MKQDCLLNAGVKFSCSYFNFRSQWYREKKMQKAGIMSNRNVFHPPLISGTTARRLWRGIPHQQLGPPLFFCFKPTMISGFNSHGLNTALKIKAQTAIIESRRGGEPPQPVRRSWVQKKTVSGRDQTSSWHEKDSGRRLTAEVGSAGQTDHSRVDATLMMLMLGKKESQTSSEAAEFKSSTRCGDWGC